MYRLLYRLGHFAGRHPWRVLGTWILIAVAFFALNSSIGGASNDTFTLPGAESQRAADALNDRFPSQSVYTSQVVLHADEGLTTRAAKQAIDAGVTALADVPHVVDVTDPYDPRGPTVSEDGQTAFSTVAFDSDKIALREYEAAHSATKAMRDAGIQVEYNGLLGYAKGEQEPGSEMIGVGVAIIVLAIAFGSLVAMSLPIAVALIGLLV